MQFLYRKRSNDKISFLFDHVFQMQQYIYTPLVASVFLTISFTILFYFINFQTLYNVN